MTIATWIAELLCPQVFTEQRAYARMKAEAIDAYHWLGAYPDAADALRWLLDNDQNRHRAIGEKAIGVLPSDISGFRSMLDTRHNQQLARIAELEKENAQLSDENYELKTAPWPEWATAVVKVVRKHSGYDGYDDATEGVDFPAELEEHLSAIEQDDHKWMEKAKAAETRIAELEAEINLKSGFIGAAAEAKDEPLRCPICDIAFQSKDICASDIEMGTCHADCLKGSPVVDLDTGDPLPGGKINTFLFGDDEEKRAAK
ncbi:hypothetical protein [Agrobacterium vitis]|uniref:hypothetical protein n=1 Tax=Agrobacterium vitis TaxID=373 RepID=UPI0008DC0CD4|nr:hypothetical protein [Agrobacterium vitis]MUO84851.1 hypothetical protein [Agrobacterium vitis]